MIRRQLICLDISTKFTNGLAKIGKKSNDLSVLKNAEEIDFESLSAQLLQKAIESGKNFIQKV